MSEPLQQEGLGSCYGTPAVVGGMMAVEEHLGGGTTPSNNCLELEPKVMGGSWTLNCYTNIPGHTLLFLCAFRNSPAMIPLFAFSQVGHRALSWLWKKSHFFFLDQIKSSQNKTRLTELELLHTHYGGKGQKKEYINCDPDCFITSCRLFCRALSYEWLTQYLKTSPFTLS